MLNIKFLSHFHPEQNENIWKETQSTITSLLVIVILFNFLWTRYKCNKLQSLSIECNILIDTMLFIRSSQQTLALPMKAASTTPLTLSSTDVE